ncbi:hemerythrin domain-containing protein [Streptomyces sp. NPDC018947]|uniref:hemerythrin domain-containing protein n=1 Tax=Streptomyces sp. NPDC018947 TaxID=3365054 RepID=UPI0037B332F4
MTTHPTRRRQLPPGRVDFSIMYLTHDAFLRDLERLRAATREGRTGDLAVRTGWETFKHQLHVHHVGEDEAIWPQLRERLERAEDVAVMDLMEAEHGAIDPMQDRIDAAFAVGGGELAAAVEEFADALAAHMEHEEERALPLVETHLGPEGWARYSQYMLTSQGLPEAGAYLAWLLDGAPGAAREKTLGVLPEPVRTMFLDRFEPQYAAAGHWSATAA